jgi:SAM-dependent methyltransferase
MSKMQDPTYLRDDQYRTADNLNARIHLHAGFSTNTYGWFRWVFDHYNLPEHCRILELACGPGDLWRENASRIPASWEIVLSDFSPGMVTQAREDLAGNTHSYTFTVIDAQHISFENDRFDAVIANHCLYHIPDQAKAFSEIQRVLVPGGKLYTTTVGVTHMAGIGELVEKFDPSIEHDFKAEQVSFTLENGTAQLEPWFTDLGICRYLDSLRVTQASPLVDFALSGIRFELGEERREAFTAFVAAEISANGGAYTIHKDSGLFSARNLKSR